MRFVNLHVGCVLVVIFCLSPLKSADLSDSHSLSSGGNLFSGSLYNHGLRPYRGSAYVDGQDVSEIINDALAYLRSPESDLQSLLDKMQVKRDNGCPTRKPTNENSKAK
jgi:hypothetical protein